MALRNTGTLLKRLRALMKNTTYVSETIQAYIVPSGDAHQSEYIAPCDKRRAFLTGFSGSAGTAIVTEDHAALWTDGRYFLQAEQQLDSNWILMKDDNVYQHPSRSTSWCNEETTTTTDTRYNKIFVG
uniref:Xaa-pro aminopeptidase n=1 Tax=Rhipicephalus zambeziensis TaxID=60191 RepID=A0A224Z866_9ACAR